MIDLHCLETIIDRSHSLIIGLDLGLQFYLFSILRYQINQILTLDRRHFNIVKPEGIKYFELLPHIFN